MGRKRKMITSAVKPLAGTKSLKSRRLARVVTSKYHSIRNEISLVDQSSLSKTEKKARKDVLGQKLEDIGGTNRYQEASIISTQHFKTSRWVLGCVDRHMSEYSDRLKANHDKKEEEEAEECNDGDGGDGDVDQKKNKRKKKSLLEVLEVGAINIQLQQASNRLRVRSIDVNSQHPLIEEKDFFDVPPEGAYDVVVCSMVVNCVAEPSRRGDMLMRLRAQLRTEQSLLLLTLPVRAVDSRFVGRDRFLALLRAMGFELVSGEGDLGGVKVTPKVVFYTLRRGKDFVPRASAVSTVSAVSAEDVGRAWSAPTAANLRQHLSQGLKRHYSTNFDKDVPPTEFCVGFPQDFFKGSFKEKEEKDSSNSSKSQGQRSQKREPKSKKKSTSNIYSICL